MEKAFQPQAQTEFSSNPCSDIEVLNKAISSCVDASNNTIDYRTDCIETVTTLNESLSTAINTSSTNIIQSLRHLESSLVDSSELLSSELSRTILSVNDGVTNKTLFFAIFISFIGAFSAFVFNLLYWRVIRKKQILSNLGKDLLDLIENIESLALTYWVNEYDEKETKTYHISEIEIKTSLRQLNKHVRIFSETIKGKIYSDEKNQLDSFVSNIYDLVTGDGFESKTRESSKPKAMKIARECSDARVVISLILIK